MIIEQIRNSKALLKDNVDAFSKQQSKEKQEKGDKKVKWQYKKGKQGNKLMP